MNASSAIVTPSASGITGRLLAKQRQKLLEAFNEFRAKSLNGSVLMVTMSGASLHAAAPAGEPMINADNHYCVHWPDSAVPLRPTGSDNGSGQVRQHAGGTRLPYADQEFDWILCTETIEHVGGVERQQELLAELYRVARRGVFLTTSNRDHPLEFNTGLPVLHWLPAGLWRTALRILGKREWVPPTRLNLLGSKTLYRMAANLPGAPTHDVGHKRVLGMKAHYFLMIHKPEAMNRPAGMQVRTAN